MSYGVVATVNVLVLQVCLHAIEESNDYNDAQAWLLTSPFAVQANEDLCRHRRSETSHTYGEDYITFDFD